MKRPLLIIGILILLVCILVNMFFSPGIHFLGNAAHLEFSSKCFIMDLSSNLSLVEESTMCFYGTVDGLPRNGGIGSYKGFVDIGSYPIPAYEGWLNLMINDNNGCLVVKKGPYLQFSYEGSKYEYQVILDPASQANILVIIQGEEFCYVAVNAGTYEEAKEVYLRYTSDL